MASSTRLKLHFSASRNPIGSSCCQWGGCEATYTGLHFEATLNYIRLLHTIEIWDFNLHIALRVDPTGRFSKSMIWSSWYCECWTCAQCFVDGCCIMSYLLLKCRNCLSKCVDWLLIGGHSCLQCFICLDATFILRLVRCQTCQNLLEVRTSSFITVVASNQC